MRFTGSVSFRPVRIGFLIPPDDLALVSRAARLSACLWGGRYNVMIPFFEAGGDRWVRPYHAEGGLNVARGYIDFFEPDMLVADHGGPTMFARIGVMRPLNRHVERVFDPSRKEKHWGRRKLARDR
jgi:hypothetical protein